MYHEKYGKDKKKTAGKRRKFGSLFINDNIDCLKSISALHRIHLLNPVLHIWLQKKVKNI